MEQIRRDVLTKDISGSYCIFNNRFAFCVIIMAGRGSLPQFSYLFGMRDIDTYYTTSDNPELQKQLKAIEVAYQNKDYNVALDIANAALKEYPSAKQVRYLRAFVNMLALNFDDSLKDLRKLMKCRDKHDYAYLYLKSSVMLYSGYDFAAILYSINL